MERHLLRNVEHGVKAVHHLGVQGRRQRADAEGVGGQHQVLARGDHRVGAAARRGEGEDDAGGVLDVVGQSHRGSVVLVGERDVLGLRPAVIVPALGPPGLLVERAELADLRTVVHDQEASHLVVAAVRRLHRGLDDQVEVLDGDGIRAKLSRRSLGEHGFPDRHLQTVGLHGRTSCRWGHAPSTRPSQRAMSAISSAETECGIGYWCHSIE